MINEIKEKENSIKIKFVACLPPAADELTENKQLMELELELKLKQAQAQNQKDRKPS